MAKCKYIIEDGGKKLSFNSKADVASYFNRTKALTEAMQAKGDVDLDEYIAGLPKAKAVGETKVEDSLQPQDESKPTSEMQTPTEAVSVGVEGVVKTEAPSAEQQLKDIKEGNLVTFEYKNEGEVPELLRDKISSKGEINGKPYVKVTMPKSLADYYLQEQPKKDEAAEQPKEIETPIEPKRDSNEGSKQEEVEPTTQKEKLEKTPESESSREGSSNVYSDITPTGEEKSKSTANRIYTGETKKSTKDAALQSGLTYNRKSLALTDANVREFVDRVGINQAVSALKEGLVKEDSAAILGGLALMEVETMILQAKTQEEIDSLIQMNQDLIEILGNLGIGGGRTISAFNYVYQKYDIGYNVEKKINDYKAENNGEISEQVETKFREADKQIKELKKQIADLEVKIREQELEESVASIKQDVEREQSIESKKSYKQKSQDLAKKVRRLKVIRPDVFSSVTPVAIVWDGAVETVATAIEAGGQLTDAINAGINYIRNSDWYKSLSDDEAQKAEETFRNNIENYDDAPYLDENGKVAVPYSLVKKAVASGVSDIQDLIDAVKKDLPETVTDREIRDAITGYGREVSKTRSELSKEVSQLKEAGKLISKIEDAENGLIKSKTPTARARLSEDIITYRARLKNLLKDIPRTADMQLAKNMVRQRTADYEQRIEDLKRTGQEPKKIKARLVDDSELLQLRSKLNEQKNIYDQEILKVREKNAGALRRFWNVASKILGIPRAIMASGELSLIFIQGGALTVQKLFSNPKQLGQAFGQLGKSFWSEKKATEFENLLKQQDWFNEAMEAGLSLTSFNEGLNSKEETFMRGYTDLIWEYVLAIPFRVFGKKAFNQARSIADKLNPFVRLERGASAYLNALRVARYQDGRKMLQLQGKTIQDNPIAYKNLASIVNVYSGRASLGKKLDTSQQALSLLFFSARNWASVIRQVTPAGMVGFLNKTDIENGKISISASQKVAMQNWVSSIGLTTSIVLMIAASLNNDDDEETEVNLDPTSTDFMKIRLGNTRVDPFGGRLQMLVYQSRMLMGSYMDSKGIPHEIGKFEDGFTNMTRAELTGNLVANKLSPVAGYVFKSASSREKYGITVDRFGNPVDWKEDLSELVLPMYWAGLDDIWEQQPAGTAGFLTFLGFLGINVSSFGTKKERIEKEYKLEQAKFKDKFKSEPSTEIKEQLLMISTFNVNKKMFEEEKNRREKELVKEK